MTHLTRELEVEWEDAVMPGQHGKRRNEGESEDSDVVAMVDEGGDEGGGEGRRAGEGER